MIEYIHHIHDDCIHGDECIHACQTCLMIVFTVCLLQGYLIPSLAVAHPVKRYGGYAHHGQVHGHAGYAHAEYGYGHGHNKANYREYYRAAYQG